MKYCPLLQTSQTTTSCWLPIAPGKLELWCKEKCVINSFAKSNFYFADFLKVEIYNSLFPKAARSSGLWRKRSYWFHFWWFSLGYPTIQHFIFLFNVRYYYPSSTKFRIFFTRAYKCYMTNIWCKLLYIIGLHIIGSIKQHHNTNLS